LRVLFGVVHGVGVEYLSYHSLIMDVISLRPFLKIVYASFGQRLLSIGTAFLEY